MPRDNLLFQAISLLSQHLSELEPVLAKTSCLNPEDRDLIGILEAMKVFLDPNKPEDKELMEDLDKIQKFFAIWGMAKWNRSELTDLGLRVGQRHKEKIKTGYEVNEVDIFEAEEGAKKE